MYYPDLRKFFTDKRIFVPVLFILIFPGKLFSQQKTGSLYGVIRDEKNQPIANASVSVEKQNIGTKTCINGDFVLKLSPGTYTIIISSIGYESQRIPDIIIKADAETALNPILNILAKENTGVILTTTLNRANARGLLMQQKANSSVTDGISDEQMKRLPVTNIGQVLSRVSGITVQNDKFVTVRGVSDRYNNALINGSLLPSTEPNRRNFSFDIIPSSLVDNVVVNKTATPDLPGEFTGGMVQINTKDVPVKNFLELTMGFGLNTESFDKSYYNFKRDKGAAIGKIDEERKWYGDGRVFDPVKSYLDFTSNDTAAMRTTASQVPNRWQRYKYPYHPALNLQLSGGLNKRFQKANSLGIVAAVIYQNEQLHEEGDFRSLGIFEGHNVRTKYTTVIGGLLNATYKTPGHKITLKNLLNHRYSLQSDSWLGRNINFGFDQVRYSDVVLAGTLFQSRVEGEHILTKQKIKVDWYADIIKYEREQPDSRYLTAQVDPVTQNLLYNFTERFLIWGGLYSAVFKEDRNNAGLNLSFPFGFKNEKQLIKIGYAYSKRDADYDGGGFRNYDGPDHFGSRQKGLPYELIATPEHLRSGELILLPSLVTGGTIGDKYTGTQALHAAYAMLDLRLLKKLRLVGGVRNENNRMDVNTVFLFQLPAAPWLLRKDSTLTYKENHLLPSVNIIYNANTKTNIRAAFSQTLSRPDFFERSPFKYFDFPEQLFVYGFHGLEVTSINNYDLRFEFYPTSSEIISASIFHKDFDKPVERFLTLNNPTNNVEYKNLYKAKASGFEIDFRKSLEFINPASPILKKMVINGNFTYLDGELSYAITRRSNASTVDDTFYVASQKRPIQNLSPYIVNFGLAYQQSLWGANLSYNRMGKRIVNGGTYASIIQYENPRDLLDLQLNALFFKQKLEMRFNASNILNSPFIIYSNNENGINTGGQGSADPNNDPKGDDFNREHDFIVYEVKKGVYFSIKAVYKF